MVGLCDPFISQTTSPTKKLELKDKADVF